jgi:hypothetical protein
VIDGGMTIDLSRLTEVVVDPVARRARCGGGATLAKLDAACQEHGLAVPAGTVSHTGVAGLTLGGGFGWLTPMAGLTIDNLISAEVVLVDGRIVRASAHECPDLFWALRGGGGNFGVVTEFEFQLHAVGPMVHLGMFFFELDRAEEAIRLGRKFFADGPRNAGGAMVGMNAPPAPFVPEEAHFAPGVALVVAGFGTADEHAALIASLREAGPLFEFVTPMPYVALQQMLDEGAPWGVHSLYQGLLPGRASRSGDRRSGGGPPGEAVADVAGAGVPVRRRVRRRARRGHGLRRAPLGEVRPGDRRQRARPADVRRRAAVGAVHVGRVASVRRRRRELREHDERVR